MIDWNTYRMKEWNKELGEDEEFAKKAILVILKDQKVSLSKTRCLFNHILAEIEDNNPITLSLKKETSNICLNAVESRNIAKSSECH